MEENPSDDKFVTVSGKYSFQMGEMFPSYEELEKRLELHCSESLVYYWRRDTRTVKGACTKTSRPIANKLKYYSLRYACVFGGEKKKNRGQGKRLKNKSLRNDCPSFIMLRASKDGENLEVVGVNNLHNHECSNYVNQNLPHTRKLPEDIKQEVTEMMLYNVDRKKIIEYVKKKTDKSITVKDLFNLKAKYKNINFKVERSKEELLQLMGMSPTTEERFENDLTMEEEDENKEWMGVSYENVIEYDEYSDLQEDSNVEIDVEVYPEDLIEYTESNECVKNEFDDTNTVVHNYHLAVGKRLPPTTTPEYERTTVIEDYDEVEQLASQQNVELDQIHPSDHKQALQKNLRSLRLKWFIRRENNRLKKKLLNCRICGTSSRFLKMQINVLRAEKQKLLEETSILRLTKEKLINDVTSIQSNVLIQ